MIFAVLQSRQMKEVPVRHSNLNFRFGSSSTSFFMTKKRKDMEPQMTTMLRQLSKNLKALMNAALGSICSYVPETSLKHERFYGEDNDYGRRGRPLCDLTFV